MHSGYRTLNGRTAFEAYLRRPVTDDIWERLVDDGYVDDLDRVAGSPDERQHLQVMAERARRLEPVGQLKPKAPQRKSADVEDRRAAIISDLCAADARSRSEVERFRSEVMGGNLIPLDAIAEWIASRARLPAPGRKTLVIELPAGHRLVDRVDGDVATWHVDPPLVLDEILAADRRGEKWSARPSLATEIRGPRLLLCWADPTKPAVTRTVVEKGSDLDRLRVLAERLAQDYGWASDAAVTFVLADVVPWVENLVVTENRKGFGARGRGRPRHQIIVEADTWVSKARVAAAVSRARSEASLPRRWPLRGRPARLLEFLAGLDDGLTWRAKMRRWNREGTRDRRDRYSEIRNFQRDAARAYKRLGTVLQIGSRASESDRADRDGADG